MKKNYKLVKSSSINFGWFCLIALAVMAFIYVVPAAAQSGLENEIRNTINNLVRIINVIIIGFVAWAGFLIARGDGSGQTRLIYGIVGLVIVNTSYMIINYFT